MMYGQAATACEAAMAGWWPGGLVAGWAQAGRCGAPPTISDVAFDARRSPFGCSTAPRVGRHQARPFRVGQFGSQSTHP
jgi:hypothetical protein